MAAVGWRATLLAPAAVALAATAGQAGWLSALRTEHDIPERAAVAYVAAARSAPCALDWRLLAGVGMAETGHGRYGGAHLDDRTGEMVGPDGQPRMAVSVAAAKGPMQFIDSTWEQYATDGDGDGAANVNDVDDAAAAAAKLLCANGAGRGSRADEVEAVGAYNGGADWRRYAESQNYVAVIFPYVDALPADPGGQVAPTAQRAVAAMAVTARCKPLVADQDTVVESVWQTVCPRVVGHGRRLQVVLAARPDGGSAAALVGAGIELVTGDATEIPAASPGGDGELVEVGGQRVAVEVAPSLRGLLAAAAASGVDVSVNSGWRSRDEQIAMRRRHCPAGVDVMEAPASACTPPTARPGHSPHETGRAVDLGRGDAVWSWLAVNAGRFGWVGTVPSEPWHFEWQPQPQPSGEVCGSVSVVGDSLAVAARAEIEHRMPGADVDVSGGRAVVEPGADGRSGLDALRSARGVCWVVELGVNDAANVSAGSAVSAGERVDMVMGLAAGRRVWWVEPRSVGAGHYSDAGMAEFRSALRSALSRWPGLRVVSWDPDRAWFVADGVHLSADGSAALAAVMAGAVAG